ncbi:hypothetical protein [Formosa sp. A9]|uniref:hypothetical protein n=1 Tax=Formosa sp. A9 TaxID=3442641 RepID=UPI003EBA573D
MKKLLTVLCLLAVSLVSAQEQNKEAILQDIAKASCDCINNKNLDLNNLQREKLEMHFGLCVLESYSSSPQAQELLNISFDDSDSLEKLGETIALKMMSECSDVMTLVVGNYLDEAPIDASNLESRLNNLKFVKLDTDNQFNVLTLKDKSSGRNYTFLWLEYFEGAQWLQNEKELKKSTLSIHFVEKDFFDSKIEEYRNFKIITKLTVN